MYKLRVKASFAAAHHLPWHPKCQRLHGHTYHVEVAVEAGELDENGIVMDFDTLRGALERVLPDHQFLNNWLSNPTAERIAAKLYRELALPGLQEVTVWESPDCGVTYNGPTERVVI